MPMTSRAIRISDDLWTSSLAATRANGDTVSRVVRAALERYVDEPEPETLTPDTIVAGIEGRAIVRAGLADVRAWTGDDQ